MVDKGHVLTESFKWRFDLFGLIVSLGAIGFGTWERLDGRAAHGDYLIMLGIVGGLIAAVSLGRRARA